MAAIRNNHVFKGHKALLGNRYVTYGEVELPTRYDQYPKSKNGFDWGVGSSGSHQLAYSILRQLTDDEFSRNNATKFVKEVVGSLNARDWILNASEVQEWIEKNSEHKEEKTTEVEVKKQNMTLHPKRKKMKKNIVKDVCKELSITQKELAGILEVPEGTVSSWAVKNEIPRLGKKAIEFYIQNKKNKEIVESYKSFLKLLDNS